MSAFDAGAFTVGSTGTLSFDYLFDGGSYQGQLGIFNLQGMEQYTPGSTAFIQEAARRALTQSNLGHVVIDDIATGAKFFGNIPWEGNSNRGTYSGIKTVTMNPGNQFGLMLVPNQTIQYAYDNPTASGGGSRPIFSLGTPDTRDSLTGLQVVDVLGDDTVFAFEDIRSDSTFSDHDYNDLIFQMTGAASNYDTPLLNDRINPERDWRTTTVGQTLLSYLYFPQPIELREQNNFTTSWEKTFQITPGTSQLSFTIDNLSFDTADGKSIKDAFEAALVDENGNSLVHTIGTGRDAFFNHTEGQSPALASGVTFSNKIVSLNLSALPKGTTAKLQLRLVNNDKDVNTIARISKIEVKSNSTFSPPVSVQLTADTTAASIVDFHKLSDISNSITTTYGRTSFNADTEILYTDLAIKNAGQYPVKGKLLLGITNISDPTVKLRNIAGTTPTGIPYIDYSSLLEDGTFVPGETTQSKTLEFDNPNGVQFTYEKVFFSQLNTAPEFTSTANKEAIIGKSYLYDVDATDEDNDSLTYSLLSGPSGLSIDSTTGKITWNPTVGNLGNHNIIIKVKDNFGGEATQQYNLSTINQPPNRPPVFTSIPVVDGKVNTPYKYEAIAKDIDGDKLTFSLLEAPDGMSVNPDTGVITWTPDGNQLGKVLVKLKVEDNAGGEAEQAFEILTQIEPGNHAPVIISAPITQFNFPGSANPHSGNVSPKAIDLNLEAGQVVQSPISLTLPSNDTSAATDTVFVLDLSGSMGNEVRWVGNLIQNLEAALSTGGLTSNRYAIVGFADNGYFVNPNAAGNDLNITLYGPNNQWLGSRTIYDGLLPDSLFETTLPTNGNYTLLLTSPGAIGSTGYDFQLQSSSNLLDTGNGTLATSTTTIQPLNLNVPITGSINSATEKDIFTFYATSGSKVFYDALEAPDNDGIYVSLLSPTGNLIFNSFSSDYDSNNFYSFTESGTYSLIFHSSGTTGDYNFQLLQPEEPQRLSLNTPINGRLDSGFKRTLYHFDATPGQRFYFDSLANANGSWYLYGPSNQYINGSSSLSYDFEATLLHGGSYTLMVTGDNHTSGAVDYNFKVWTKPTTTVSLDLNAPIIGSIDVPGEVDVFTFDGTSGTKLYYDALEADYDYINAKLVSPSGTTIFERNSDSDYSLVTLTETGKYRLIFDGTAQTTGNYQFQLLAPGLNFGQNLSNPVTASLDSGLETALYQFNGTAGTQLVFDSLANANGNWYLYRPDNQYLNGTSLSYDFSATLPVDGAYTLMVFGDNYTTNEVNYSFKINAPTPVVTANSIAPSNSSMMPLQLNVPITGSINSATEKNIFTFSGTPGQVVYYDALEAPDYDGIYVSLLSPTGNLILTPSSSDSDSNLISLTESGTYSLIFHSSGTTGDYNFQLLQPEETKRLSFNTPINGYLDNGFKRKLYHFDTTPGQRFYFDSLANANGNWTLYGPNNESIYGNSLGNDFEVTLPQAGSYTLMVSGDNYSNNSVNYNFQLINSPTTVEQLNLNAPVNKEIALAGEIDVFTFEGTPGTTLYYDALEEYDYDNITVSLVSPSGNRLIGQNTDYDFIPFTLTEAGTYRLIIDGNSNTTGDYKFQLLATNSDSRLTRGQTVNHQLSSGYQTALYHFNGTAGTNVTLKPTLDKFFGTATEVSAAVNGIIPYSDMEEGYGGINVALSHNRFRPGAARNLILITDDQRQPIVSSLNSSNILDGLIRNNARLNTVVSAEFQANNNISALGVDANGNAYIANGTGGFTFTPGGQFIPPYYDDTTKLDYIDLAWYTGGAAWDISKLRYADDGGLTAQSFSNAFVQQLQQQIQSQLAIDVIPSDDTVSFTNLTGILNNVKPGDTANFTASFTGDGNSHNFDLLFVRPGTNTILGSIPVTINSNAVYFYPVQAIDPDGDELTYKLIEAPTGASIDASTGRVSWKPTSAGNYTFDIQVADSRGGVATQTYQLLVKSGGDNTNPEITSIAPTTAAIGQTYNYQVSATDIDSDRLSFYLVDAPDNALIDKETGLLTWTPSAVNEIGQSLTVKVLDSRGGVATQTIQVNVLPDVENIAPQFDSDPILTSTLGQTYRYDPIVTDPNADRLQFDLAVKPEGMTVSTQTGTVVWQPNADQVGKHNVVLRVFDGRGGVDLQSYQINVQPANRPPAFTSNPSLQAIVGRAYQYPVRVIDADADSISFRLENPPDEMLVDEKGILSWTPTVSYLGEQSVTIIASDGRGGEAKQTFNLNVVQDAPNSDPIITSTPRQVIGLGNNYFYQVEVDNADSDPLSYSLETHPTGMSIDEAGRIFWKPTAAQFGNNNVKIKVDDGRGGIDVQEFTVKVVSKTTNAAPDIDSTPPEAATVLQEYRYDLAGSDPDGDPLLWTLDAAPDGLSIDPERGTILWTPTADQVGEYEVAVRVVDSLGAYAGQAFTVTVRGVNVAPTIDSLPPTTAAINQAYKYAVLASDVENDKLQFSLNNPPSGMTIDADTGLIEWIPNSGQLGEQNVEVIVEDSRGAITKQKYRIFVKQTAENLAPTITSVPLNVAAVNQIYRYEITATDPEGEAVQYQLLEKPNGMMVDPVTGVVQWTPSQTGVYYVTVGAVDSSGAGGAQRFEINVAVNQVPVISSSPVESVTLGKTYRYDVKVTDGNGDKLVYSLTNHPEGMEIDEWGRISWSPADAGSFPVVVTVKDSRGASVSQPYSLSVVADNTAPKVNLWMNPFGSVDKGEDVSFVVSATDDVGVSATVLRVNDRVVPLDEQGRATVKMDTAGAVNAVATATDAAGNAGSASNSINVIDPSDNVGPDLEISSLEDDAIITAPINIIGTVNDSNLSYYRLLVSTVDGGEEREVFRGTSQVNNGVLGKFDPSVLGNDSYVLRLEAADTGGNVSSVERVVNVAGELKLGNFRLSFTDLSIPVAGIPINVTRTYDSLNANSKDDFGYGWRLEFRDTDLRTSLKKDEVFEQLGVRTVAFKDKTRVYITLPGGKREAFTFKPIRDRLSGFLQAAAPPGVDAGIYHPAFEGDKGVTSKLTVVDTQLTRVGNEYFGFNGEVYNPADSAFGGKYVLTTKEGIVYEIDGISGDLLTATNPNGNKLTFTDAGITSNTGKSITFGRDAQGRITSVTDLLGKQVKYQYDAKGDLVGVTDRENNTTTFEYFAPNRPHFLTEINDPLGKPQVRTEYDEKGRLKKQLDVNGKDMEFIYDPANSIQTVFDVFDKPTTYVYDERGNVVQEVNALGGITKRTFDENNNLLSQTNPENETFTYTYDSDGNLITVTNPLGNVTRYTFNRFGEVLTKTDSSGRTTTYTYDSRGNRRTLTDAEGNVSKYNLDLVGNVTEIIDADNKSTRFEYDQFGNITRQVDALNNETTYTYDANGNQLSESTTVTTPTGKKTLVTNWTYDTEGHVKSMTDPQGSVIRQEYDKLGNLAAVVEEGMNNRRTEYRYDEKGQLEQTLYADGTSVRSVYDAAGREIATIDQKGQTTHFVYDANGRLIETIYPDNTPLDLSDNPRTKTEYDKIGRAKASIDEQGNRTEYEYDKAGRQTLIRDALNNETKYTYNSAGNRLTQTDARNNTTKFVYDELGRQVETHFADGTRTITTYDAVGRRSSLKDQAGNTTYFVYDALNRPIEVIHPDDTPLDLSNNPRTKTEYNELGWVTAQIDELGNRQEYSYDEKGRLIESRSDCSCRRKTYTYDAFGNRISETDQLGHTTSFVYDKLNRLVETHFHDGSYTTTTYDELGRVKTQTDQAGKITKFEYDALGRLTAVVDALQQRTEYSYDDSGNLIQAKDANQHITQYEYDGLNRRTATILPLGQRSDTTYDPVGNIASTIDFNRNTITYEYDKLNRMLAKRLPDTTAVEWTYTPTGQIKTTKDQRGITTYDYDVRERLTSRIDPDNQFIRYRYDAASNRTEVITPTGTTKYTYDKYNQLETVTDPNFGLTRYTYDKAGNLIRTVLPNNTVETRQYNDLNRLVFLENTRTSGVISSYRYTLDPVGNRKVVEEHDGRKVEYNYDDLYRLTQEKITDPAFSNRTINYTYDAVGNRKSSNDSVDGLTNYTYDNNDRLLSDGSSSYTYDNNGNTLSRIKDATDRVIYSWDYENRLVGADITKPSGTVQTQYKYNPDSIRVATIVNGQETRYLIDANQAYAQVLEEYTPGGVVQASYVYGKDLISQQRGGVRSFYHVDGLGSTRALTNASGVVTDTYDYGAYGNLLGSVNNTINNYRFAGEQFDPYLGDYYLRRRYYDSDSGRFTTTDPFEGVMTEPLSRAKYPYVHGNPVNAIDPSGLFSITENTATQLNISSLASQSVPTIKTATTLSTGTFPEAVTAASPGIANVGRASISIGARVAVNVAKLASRLTIVAEELSIEGFPSIIWGDEVPETTNHTRDAILGQGNAKSPGGIAPSFLLRIQPGWQRSLPHPEFYNLYPNGRPYPRQWYNNERQCYWDNTNPIASQERYRGMVCDEYPYASTAQGGPLNYELNTVSLRLVPAYEQASVWWGKDNPDSQGWKLSKFYDRAKVQPYHPTKGWFIVGFRSQGESIWIDRDGNIIAF